MPEINVKKKRGQRGPGKKNLLSQPQPNPIPNQNPPLEGEPNSEGVEFNIESQETKPTTEKLSFGETLKRAGEGIGLFDDTESAEPKSRKTKKANQEEFNTLVIAVLTLGISFSGLPQPIQPNQNELAVFSNHLSGILIRHLPIAKGFSADALDIIGLFAVLSGWYARVQPELALIREKKKPEIVQRENAIADPIGDLSPEVGQFLNAAAKKNGVSE